MLYLCGVSQRPSSLPGCVTRLGHVTSAAAGPDHERKQMMVVVLMFRPRHMNQASVFTLQYTQIKPHVQRNQRDLGKYCTHEREGINRKQAAVRFMTEEKKNLK